MKNCIYLMFIILIGCSGGQYKTTERNSFSVNREAGDVPIEEESAIPGISDNINRESPPKLETKLIKEAYLSILTENAKLTLDQVKQLVNQLNGYITKEEENEYGNSLSINALIRIPSQNFDTLVTKIEKLAKKVENKSIEVKDVTEEFIDIQSRLKTKKDVEKRYLEILKKANSTEEILKVEEQLGKIREEIELVEGRLKYLQNKISYSTIDLRLNEKLDKKEKFEFFSKIGKALKGGWLGFLNFTVGLFYIWPLIIILILVVYLFKKFRKKGKATE